MPPPENGVLFNGGGFIGTATNAAIADGADLAFGEDFALTGDVRIPRGMIDVLGWQARKRSDAGDQDLLLLGVLRGSDPAFADQFFIGGDPFTSPLHEQTFNAGNIFVRIYHATLLVDPATIIDDDFQGIVTQQTEPGQPLVSTYITKHSNFAIYGIKESADVADFGSGQGVFLLGHAEVRPTASNPVQGSIVYNDAADSNLYYKRPDGTIVPMRPQPAVLVWGADDLDATTGTFGLAYGMPPGYTATAAVREIPNPSPARATDLFVLHGTAPGNTNLISYTLHVNGVPTALSVTMQADAISASISGMAVDIPDGARLSLVADAAVDIGASPTEIAITVAFAPVIPP